MTFKNKYKNIMHYGCFFHFLKNCRKKLVSKGYGTNENKNIYKKVMNFCAKLPPIKDINKNIKSEVSKFFKKNKEILINLYLMST